MKVKRTDDILVKLDMMKQTEIEELTGEGSKPRKFFRGSEVGHCSNQINFRRRGTPVKEIALSKSRFLDDGHLHQGVLSAELRKAGIKVTGEESEEYIKIDYGKGRTFKLKCHKDGTVKTDGEKELLEVKSVKEEKFQEILKTGDVSDYYDQIQMYLFSYDLRTCKNLIVDRNNSLRQEFTIYYDKSRVRELIHKLGKVEDDLKAKRPSSKDYARNSKQCGWCPYFEACWGVKRGGFRREDALQKAVEVDGKRELKTWDLLLDLYLKYQRLSKEAKQYKSEADDMAEILFKKFKATKLFGEGGSIVRSVKPRSIPDKATIQELIIKGVIPVTNIDQIRLTYHFKNGDEEKEDE